MLTLGVSLMMSVSTIASETVTSADSLRELLKYTHDVDKRATINVHLADIYTDSGDFVRRYWYNSVS